MNKFLRAIDRWLIEAVMPYASSYRIVAQKFVGPDEAEDIVQEAYVRLLRSPQWREIRDPRAFMLTIIRNLAIERIKRRSVIRFDQLADIDYEKLSDSLPDAFDQLASRAELAQLLELIRDLPPQCQRVIWMRKIDGLSPPQIAETLNLSVSTVEKHLVKGLARITLGMRNQVSSPSHLLKSRQSRK